MLLVPVDTSMDVVGLGWALGRGVPCLIVVDDSTRGSEVKNWDGNNLLGSTGTITPFIASLPPRITSITLVVCMLVVLSLAVVNLPTL